MRMVRQGRFPRRIKLGPGDGCAVRFAKGEVDGWIDARLTERGMHGRS